MIRSLAVIFVCISLAMIVDAEACGWRKKAQVEAVPTTTTTKSLKYGYGDRDGGGRGDWGRDDRGRGDWRRGPGRGPGWGRGPSGVEVAGGVIIGSAISSWLFPPKPQVVVVEQPPPPPPPEGPEAWSPEWLDYCNGKYRSFNAKTGYYTGYDGAEHFCR